MNLDLELFDNEPTCPNTDSFASEFQMIQAHAQIFMADDQFSPEYGTDSLLSFSEPSYALKSTTDLMFSVDPLQNTKDDLFTQTEAHQKTAEIYSAPVSSSSSSSSASSINNFIEPSLDDEFSYSHYVTDSDIFSESLSAVTSSSSNSKKFDEDYKVFKNSPLSISDVPLQEYDAELANSSPKISQYQYTPETSPTLSAGLTPSGSQALLSTNAAALENARRSSLDSRLSLQKLGEVLKTSSHEETVKIEKFILNIFGKDLGFPLGYKTWIRDTSESYRRYLLNELFRRVVPTYPALTKSLLETVIKRATYSMMQGRLRKERRARSKTSRKKSLGKLSV
jgi:hypothetical protein